MLKTLLIIEKATLTNGTKMELKAGVYIVKSGNWKIAYMVDKVMPKTVELIESWARDDLGNSPLDPNESSQEKHYRYPKSLFIKQVENAEYRPYKN